MRHKSKLLIILCGCLGIDAIKSRAARTFSRLLLTAAVQILTDAACRQWLREVIELTRHTRPFVIDAWVLLPEHLHCIWTLPEGDADYQTRWRVIKTEFSKRAGKVYHNPEWMTHSKQKRRESTLWQRRFWEHTIRDDRDYTHHVDYIHYNPVKHGWVTHPRDWPYSTYHRYLNNGIYPPDWGETEVLIAGEFGESI